MVRAIILFCASFFIILASHYAIQGQINFGIVTCCQSVNAPLNCLLSYFFWKEKMTGTMILGAALIISGVACLAIAKGNVVAGEES